MYVRRRKGDSNKEDVCVFKSVVVFLTTNIS